ncbi:hypothetical protein CVT25_009076 [Psilocybe cyanescens]|uniref:Uncharacterized protein n=1 Tax=Psilocybe cyanescens TaxID=93625 RepID=A0A409VNB6_PSICY|nr:hypothetical protein CVT25_009076 [Psilocybe cyanescens]
MSQIDTMIESLANRRTMLRRRINAMSPTAQLPPEIMTEIFRLVCHAPEEGGKSITPLFFGRICKEWRDIAWSTPLLWSTLSLHISQKTYRSQAHLLKDWLLRAQISPLYIKLTTDDEHESTFCSLRSIMDVLATRSKYWHSLDTILPPQCHDILIDNHFSTLTSLSVRPPKGTISTFSEPPNMFLSAPKLRDVDLSGYNFSAMVLPWGQLRRFKTQFLTVGECLKILQRSPNLKECHLENVYSPELFPASITNPLESHLESLDVTLIKAGAVSLLESVTLPSLCALRINYSLPGSFILPVISSLVMRSGCNLRRLYIEKQGFHDDDLISCLEAVPSISHLRLIVLGDGVDSSTGLTAKLAAMLHPSYQSGGPLLPNLTCLEYQGRVYCDEGSLISMLSERWRVPASENPRVARLTMVNIISPSAFKFSAEFQHEIEKLSKEGMHLDIRLFGVFDVARPISLRSNCGCCLCRP